MKRLTTLFYIIACILGCRQAAAQEAAAELVAADIDLSTPWAGKHVGFLGDSMTDPRNTSADTHYWTFLHHLMGIEPHVYARSGFQWDRMLHKAQELHADRGDDVDAIIIWCGTNDYNHSVPIGEFFTVTDSTANVNGTILPRRHREPIYTDSTLCGRINRVMHFLKSTYPTKQIIVMTPIHRGYACFSDTNVQPDEYFANGRDLYIEDYVEAIKRGAALWAVPVIDLYSISGLYPNLESNTIYIGNEHTDRLHPNSAGHYRIARTIQARLQAIPPTF